MFIAAEFLLKKESFTLDVNLQINKPKITIISGQLGSGKTTLLRCILGLERARGKLIINDKILQDNSADIFIPTHLRKIGYTSQKPSLFPHLSIEENLFFGRNRNKNPSTKIDQKEVIEVFQIQHLFNRSVQQLSGGESQKIALARSLLIDPEILIMDEPLSAVDSENKKDILNYLKELKNHLSLPMLYVSHLEEETKLIGEEFIKMRNGKIVSIARQ